MDIEKYIASGILEAYALDELPANEKVEVAAKLALYPELKAELDAIEEGLENLALESAVTPPDFLKDKILGSVEDEISGSVERESGDQEISKSESRASGGQAKVVAMRPNTGKVWRQLVAASIVITLVSTYLAVDYRTKWKDSQESYEQITQNLELQAENFNQVKQDLDKLEQDFNVLTNSDFGRFEMASVVDGQDQYSASVFWNQKTLEAYLSIGTLKTLAQEQQYQLWAIIDGKPVSMGVFDFDSEGLLKMENVSGVATFAVTIEPRGGSENPTLSAMQVAGNVG